MNIFSDFSSSTSMRPLLSSFARLSHKKRKNPFTSLGLDSKRETLVERDPVHENDAKEKLMIN